MCQYPSHGFVALTCPVSKVQWMTPTMLDKPYAYSTDDFIQNCAAYGHAEPVVYENVSRIRVPIPRQFTCGTYRQVRTACETLTPNARESNAMTSHTGHSLNRECSPTESGSISGSIHRYIYLRLRIQTPTETSGNQPSKTVCHVPFDSRPS